MKNLELLELIHKPLTDIFENATIFTQVTDITYFISNDSLYKYDFVNNETTELCPQTFEGAIQLKVLTIENKVCVVTKECIFIFDPDGRKELQTVTFDIKISAIRWNPSEELVAIVGENGAVATYSIDYENGEVFLRGESNIDADIPDTVYVGWGSKDTQFRGSEGKLKKQTPVEVKSVEDKEPRISWRGNGEMFVVNYWTEGRRKFAVFETPCTALYRSEDCPGLQSPVAWRPAGNMIATVAETTSQSIVIFEKNGQRRFTFDLGFGSVMIKELKWSPCAQILTILTENPETKSQTIHLLMASNYKWYEKQNLTFTSDNPLLNFDWLESTQMTFNLRVITRAEIVKYVFRHVVTSSDAICGVIDGKNLQITDFRDSVIPPIMCLKKITHSTSINFVFFDKNTVVIVDSENHLTRFDLSRLEAVNSIDLNSIGDLSKIPLACHHFRFEGSEIRFSAETAYDTVIYNVDSQNEINFVDVSTSENDRIVKIIDDCHLMLNCHFYVKGEKLSDCVNSFTVFDNYLLYTTKTNELFCLRRNEDRKGEIYRRSIEQGATIVTAIPNSPKVVLQLPRGNLETISCRLISIDILDRLLDEVTWEEALRFIRLEKLNANLLFDLDPKRFLGQIDRFIDGVKTINELNSFCLEFDESNVLKTIYKNWGKVDDYPGKIKSIFGGILEYFDRVDYADYITTIMIINLNFYTLRDALVYLLDLLKRSYDDESLKQKLIEAINTLKTYGCDQEKLYTESLLLYDLDLAHFVASCCQLDPRIYEPHLNNLKNLPEVERRYEINLYGKKPKSAVAYLLRCPKFDTDTVVSFIKQHNISREAYETCPKNSRHYSVISQAFAEDLGKKDCHHEAGVVLKRAGLLKEAVEEFKLALNWREVINLTADETERLRTVYDLAERLSNQFDTKEAAHLYEFYAGNYEMAIKILLRSGFYNESLHIAQKHNRKDIIVSEIVPKLISQKKILENFILPHLVDSLGRYRTRLAEVRRVKLDRFNNDLDEEYKDNLFSDAGSTITKSSRSSRSVSSRASSRKRRKEERKKRDLREGGAYEDIALIRYLHMTIKDVYSKGEDIYTLCTLLLQESDVSYNEVKKLYDSYGKILENAKSSIGEIWPPHFNAGHQTNDVRELADLENFKHLDEEYRTPPQPPSERKLNLFQ